MTLNDLEQTHKVKVVKWQADYETDLNTKQ